MKSSTTFFKRTLALVTAGISALTITSCGKSLSPMETVEEAAEVNIERFENSDFMSDLEKITEGGSVEIRGNLSEIIAFATGYPISLDGSVKLYANADENSPYGALSVNIGMQGNPLFDALAYLDFDHFAISSNSLLGEDAYGISFENFAETLDNSVFGPNGELTLGDEFYSYIDMLEAFLKLNSEKAEIAKERFDAFLDEIKPTVYAAIEKGGKAELTDGTISLSDTETKTTDVVLSFGAADFISTAKEILNAVKASESLKPLTDSLYDSFALYEEYSGQDYRETDNFTAKELYDSLIEAIDNGLADLVEIDLSDEDIAELSAKITISIAKKTGELVAVNVGVSDLDGQNIDSTLKLPSSFSDEWGLDVNVNDGSFNQSMGLEYKIYEDTDSKFSSALVISANNESMELLSITLDKRTGEYLLAVTDPDYGEMLLSVAGKYTKDKNSKTFTVTAITVENETMTFADIALILTYKDTVPKISKFTDVLTMTGDELTATVSKITSAFGSLLG